ncbi:MAG: FAD-binding dehydrogenase [Opitutaceae bacterium]|nr:FAD-binding dehydrogenase [Opitutaceae bacterium]
MEISAPSETKRALKAVELSCDLAVAGGGLGGVCTAITAARVGLKVVLVQDRPVLGGNSSSEVRLWVLGATSHMGNNNRWAREGGVINEILVENMHRNPEGNAVLVDSLLLEFVVREPNITLLLNTAVYDLEKSDADTIQSLRAFCSQNSTEYFVTAPLFSDSTGDGIVGFMAGAAFRMGAESAEEFGEGMAPTEEYGELLGHSIYFYSRNEGKPVRYVPPSFALDDITKIPRFRDLKAHHSGCWLWWIEYGGRLDTIHETETIKWELWKVVYGVWNYIKNSGKFPEAENLTLEWVGMIPGKRESRRFEGDVMLTQQDVIEQREQPDAVSFGGWSIDLHPADGVFSEKPGCNQYHSKGVYGIPYRALYSRNIKNLFLGGRLISSSHVAFGSTRVMATCANNGQAVAMAAKLCRDHGCLPRDVASGDRLIELQQSLLKVGQHIPGSALDDPTDLARTATITASSTFELSELKPNDQQRVLEDSWAMMLPVKQGNAPAVTFTVNVSEATTLAVELCASSKPCNHTPDLSLAKREIELSAGENQTVTLDFDAVFPHEGFAFYTLHANPLISVSLSDSRVSGLLAVTHQAHKAVVKSAVQTPPENSGVDTFGFWTPLRRPGGENMAVAISPALAVFEVSNLTNGVDRPVNQPNAWVAEFKDESPSIELTWSSPQTISRVELVFDTDADHPMESVLFNHPERDVIFCVKEYRVIAGDGYELFAITDNHQTRRSHLLSEPVTTNQLRIELTRPHTDVPAALFAVRIHSNAEEVE